MSLSNQRYSDLRLAISTLIQKQDWNHLFELCGTSDDEQSRIISNIFAMYEPKHVWRFVDYGSHLSAEDRRSRRASVRTLCYILGKIGQNDAGRTLKTLRLLLSDDHMLRTPVLAALSNLWVLKSTDTASILWKTWILSQEENDDLQEISVRSTEYLASREPRSVEGFLSRVARLQGRASVSARIAKQLLETYVPTKRRRSRRIRKQIKRRTRKKDKRKRRS